MISISNNRETGSQTVAVTKADYGASGQSDIPPILVHGSWVSHSNCDQVAPQLVETSRVVTYDRRGHSDGGRSATSDSVHDDVTNLAALIEHVGIVPACVGGNSFGASVELRVDASRPALAGDAVFEGFHPEMRERLLGNAEVFFGREVEPFVSYVPDAAALAGCRVPTVVVAGVENRGVYYHEAAMWVAGLFGLPLRDVPGAHVPYMDRAGELAEALRRLLHEIG